MKAQVTLVTTRILDTQDGWMSLHPADPAQRRKLRLSESQRAFFVYYPRHAPYPSSVEVQDLRIGDVLFWQNPEDNICNNGVIGKIEPVGVAKDDPAAAFAVSAFAGINVFANCPTASIEVLLPIMQDAVRAGRESGLTIDDIMTDLRLCKEKP